ncbi:MAG TPA: alpha/beta fold hydrolase [Kofleriaceae bacterium]
MAAPSLPPEKGKTFAANGVQLYVEVIGSAAGAPLVVVNGGPGFDHTYEHAAVPGNASAWDLLARQRKVVFYDQRGNGKSSQLQPGQTCTLADQIADLEAVRAHLGVEKIDLLGHSWGGYLAMAYAARHPDHVRHLLVVDSAAPKWSDTVSLFKDIFPEGQERADGFTFADAMGDVEARDSGIKEYFHWLFYAPDKRDVFLAQVGPGIYNKAISETLEHDLARFDLSPELGKFRFPAMVITGRYDINVAPSVAYKVHKAIPSSKLVVFEKSGHLPFFEEPERFAQVLEGFLGSPK